MLLDIQNFLRKYNIPMRFYVSGNKQPMDTNVDQQLFITLYFVCSVLMKHGGSVEVDPHHI